MTSVHPRPDPHVETELESPQLEVEGLRKVYSLSSGLFRKSRGLVHAVDDISFSIRKGESLGLVGESGCGKTTTGKLLLRLQQPTSGNISFRDRQDESRDVAQLKGRNLKAFRREAQMIFQDPYESMNPRRSVLDIVAEPLAVQGVSNPLERMDRVSHILELVGISPASSFLFRYPHELSGGQRQRVAIARALVIGPSFVVADEPTSMLDVSVRIGVMKLMSDLAERFGLSYLFITHDLATARYMCDRIAVMYLGKIVEIAETEELLKNPQHPYTKALLSAIPVPRPGYIREPVQIKGGISRSIDPPNQCRFYERCPMAVEFCREAPHPPLENKGDGHMTACYRV